MISEALKEAHEKNVEQGRSDTLQVVVFGRNRMESPGAAHLGKALALYKDSLLHIQVLRELLIVDAAELNPTRWHCNTNGKL